MSYKVKEIFGPTIQGEGSYAGSCVYFIRLAGCNRWTGREKDREKSICKFCDTDFVGGESMERQEIVSKLLSLGAERGSNIVISGGEPTLQIDENLLIGLNDELFSIHLETNGSKKLGLLINYFDHVTLSPKQSMEQTKLEQCDDLKILHPSISEDISHEKFRDYKASERYVQPVMDDNYQSNIFESIELVTKDNNLRLSVQLHKIIGVG